MIPLTGAADWSREAVLTTSPATIDPPRLGRAPRRSSCGGASSTASAAPHARQKRATSGLSWPQVAQTGTSEDYDEPQPTPQRHFGPVPVPRTGARPEGTSLGTASTAVSRDPV